MPRFFARAGLTAALLTSAACLAPVAVADDLVDATEPKHLVSILRGMGQPAELDTDDVGDPLIRSEIDGTRYWIVFYGCDEERHDRCEVLLFRVGYALSNGIDLDRINDWNATELMGRAFRDEENDPWLEMAWNLDGGVTARNFESTVEWWEAALTRFEQHIKP